MKKRLFLALLIIFALCLSVLSPVCAFAEGQPEWVKDGDRTTTKCGVTTYVSKDGTCSANIESNGIIWLNLQEEAKAGWLGIDNSNGTFKQGSRFHARWVTKSGDPEFFAEYKQKLQPENAYSLNNNFKFLEIGVDSPDGKSYLALNESVPLYIQIGDEYNKEDLALIFANEKSDEKISCSFTRYNSPEGKENFLKADIRHFGEVIAFGEKVSFIASVFSRYKPAVIGICAAIAVIATAFVILIVKRKKKN